MVAEMRGNKGRKDGAAKRAASVALAGRTHFLMGFFWLTRTISSTRNCKHMAQWIVCAERSLIQRILPALSPSSMRYSNSISTPSSTV